MARVPRRWIVIAFLVTASIAAACGDSGKTPAGPTQAMSRDDSGAPAGNQPGLIPAGSGTLTVRMKDSPFGDAKAVLVTFKEVSVHRSGADWETVALTGGAAGRTCDLKQLQNATDVLGVGTLAAGQYTQVRLTVERAALYFDSAAVAGPCGNSATFAVPAGLSASLKIPSGTIKLNREFTVPDRGATTMLLDFDGDKSIKQTGGGNGNANGNGNGNGNGASSAREYMMTPVIHVVSVE
jgi:hypothetical protein